MIKCSKTKKTCFPKTNICIIHKTAVAQCVKVVYRGGGVSEVWFSNVSRKILIRNGSYRSRSKWGHLKLIFWPFFFTQMGQKLPKTAFIGSRCTRVASSLCSSYSDPFIQDLVNKHDTDDPVINNFSHWKLIFVVSDN